MIDRLGTTTYPDSSTEVLGYDVDGNVLSRLTRAGQTIGFTGARPRAGPWPDPRDTLNRLTGRTEPAGTPSVTYGYDLVGRLISVSDNGPAWSRPRRPPTSPKSPATTR